MIKGHFVTATEAANQLGVHASLISRWCREGRLAAEQVGRQWLIARRSLMEFARQPRRRGNPNFIKRKDAEKSKT